MTLDAIAAGLPVLHCGALENGDPRLKLVQVCTPSEVLSILKSPDSSNYKSTELPAENTFNHAVKKIMDVVS